MLKRGKISAKFFVYVLFLIIVGLTYTTAQLGQLGVPGEGDAVKTKQCLKEECGLSPGMPNYICPDGKTVAGPACQYGTTSGKCSWEIIGCPEQACAEVITLAADVAGNCKKFPTSCLPSGWTKVEVCPKRTSAQCSELTPEECVKYDNCEITRKWWFIKRCVDKPTCPIPECAAPPEGCRYEGGKDSNGCETCGKLFCNKQCTQDSDCDKGVCPDGTTYQRYSCISGTCVAFDYVLDPCTKAECKTSADCPRIDCIRAPCPQNTCVNGKCVMSTCGNNICEEGEADYCPSCVYEETCKVACYAGTCPQDCKVENRCTLKPDPGICKAIFKRYYFDQVERICKEFIWGGCQGTVPFETLEKCQVACEKEQGFRTAKWECYDGYVESQGSGASCKSSETWLGYARGSCKGRCNKEQSKCGIDSFTISNGC